MLLFEREMRDQSSYLNDKKTRSHNVVVESSQALF